MPGLYGPIGFTPGGKTALIVAASSETMGSESREKRVKRNLIDIELYVIS